MLRTAGLLALLVGVLIAVPSGAHAQSIVSGSLTGRVVDESGAGIFDAEVQLQRPGSGALLTDVTNRAGEFSFAFLTPGDYSLRIEAVGFRPLRVTNLPVRPGGSVPFVATVYEAAPPVTGVDSLGLPGVASNRVRTGESRWLGSLELQRLPDGDRAIQDLVGLTALGSAGSGLEGLPASMLGLYVDGLRVSPLALPGMHTDPLFGALVPRLGMSGIEVVRGNGETEWNSGGGVASIITRAPASQFGVSAYADYTGGSLWSSSALEGDVPEHQSLRGGAIVDLPIVPDSVLATFGVEVIRSERPRPALFGTDALPAWVNQVGGLQGALDAPTVESRDLASAFARVDWRLSSDARVSIRANVASMPEQVGAPAGYPLVPGEVPLVDGRDVSAGLSVQVPMNDEMQIEAKVGIVSSKRTYGASGGFPFSRIPELPTEIGTHPSIPGTLSSTIFEFTPTASFLYGDHSFKIGVGGTIGSHDLTQSPGTSGDFVLGGAQGTGVFSVTGGSGLRSDFAAVSYNFFAQDTWDASPGVQLLFGVRADIDQLPESEVQISALYDSLYVGRLGAAQRPDTLSDVRSFSTRFSFVWDVAEENRTFVRGGGGVSYDPIDPTVFHEWILGDGRRTVATSVDAGTWPVNPTGGSERPWLTLSGPTATGVITGDLDFKRARTTRAHFGLTRALSGGVAVHVGTAFRRTDNLMRRLDMNLTPQTSGVDQFGRPIFGGLLKRGGSIAPVPSLNRRFPGLAQVDFLNFDGWSEYRDFSIGIERRGLGPLELFANYTFSKTEDNMVGWADLDVNERRAPILNTETQDTWAEGVSDFDAPHRIAAGFTLDVTGLRGLQLSGVYRYRSGIPFTPGFRPGVDANGDGAFGNDPAYIGGIELGSIGSEWSCVRSLANGPVERNSCRGGAIQSLDLRITFGLGGAGGRGLELIVDALNVVEPDIGIRDAALYLVDPLTSIGRSGLTYNVPLTANPNFGNLAVPQTPGRILRLGLRVAR